MSYRTAGVAIQQEERALTGLMAALAPTHALRTGTGRAVLPNGFFANVLDLGRGQGLAIGTDGVGTKVLIAQMMDKYDTVGIDCVAMNANDVLCVGAEPISLVDYIAVQEPNERLLEELAKGLAAGAEMAGINIPGGEIAQIREVIEGWRPGFGFDLVGTCVGLVDLERVIVGKELSAGDVIIGLRSSGIHSNGLTLARRALFEQAGLRADTYRAELGRTVGEELLEPTRIYVREVLAMIAADLRVKALAHITSDGFLNLLRLHSKVSYVIDNLPEPHPIFCLIQEHGRVDDAQMYKTYNMGIGFCVITPEGDVEPALEIARAHGAEGHVLGYTSLEAEPRVVLRGANLAGTGHEFAPLG